MTEDVKQILNDYKEETKRHFDVVAEDLKGEIGTVSEQVASNAEKIDTLSEQVTANTETLETIKLDLEFIKNELKQKVARDEFAALEKRVSLIEGKLNR